MSDPDNMIYTKAPVLLTIKGQVSIQFLDGQVIEGEFATQDQFNIFLKVNGEPMMISRSQIRFMKGKYIGQIAEDDTQETFMHPKVQTVNLRSEIVQRERFDTEEYTLPPASQPTSAEEEDGTLVLDQNLEIDQISSEDNDDEGTLVIDINQYPLDQTEADEGTVILPAGAGSFPWPESDDNNDGTLVLEPFQLSPAEAEDDLDVTVVMSDLPALEEDATVVIEEKKEPQITANLICTGGPHAGEIFQLRTGISTMGRSSDNVFVLAQDKEISRHHAIILQESGRFVIQDQNSLNGTFVNDEQITGPRYLKDGDEILVGLSILKYQEE